MSRREGMHAQLRSPREASNATVPQSITLDSCGRSHHAEGRWQALLEDLRPGVEFPRSRFSRRLARLAPLFDVLFAQLAQAWKSLNDRAAYIIDSFPTAAVDNIRIRRARLYRDEAFRGYIPSKRRYFFGLHLCLLTTASGAPVAVFLLPGSLIDGEAVKRYGFDLPEGSTVYADRGCTDYTTEDLLQEAQAVQLSA